MSCRFFTEHGFCARGSTCSQTHGSTTPNKQQKKDTTGVVDICFSFDQTGSMHRWLDRVAADLRQICRTLFQDEATGGDLRIALIAHGCHRDGLPDVCTLTGHYVDDVGNPGFGSFNANGYDVRLQEFTTDVDTLLKFISRAGSGGACRTSKACYDLVLHRAATVLRWRPEATKVLVMIGDAAPHTLQEGRRVHDKSVVRDWQQELSRVAGLGVVVYGVQCGGAVGRAAEAEARAFYDGLANRTGGQRLALSKLANMPELFKALCLANSSPEGFRRFHETRVSARSGVDAELRRALEQLRSAGQVRQSPGHPGAAARRLLKDLAEVARGVGPHLAVVLAEDDLYRWHVNLQVVQGPFANVPVHLVLQFPRSYPARPPTARLVTWMPEQHANVDQGYVCLGDLDGDGWSAGYSIVNLLVSIASLVTEPGAAFERWLASLGRAKKKKLMAKMRATTCPCGHLTSRPFPPLPGHEACVPLSVVLPQADTGEEEDGKRSAKRVQCSMDVVVAGTVAETRAANVWGRVRSDQPFNAHLGACAFEVNLEFFVRDGDAPSAFVVGFGAADDSFLGVTSAGRVVLPSNQASSKSVFQAEPAVSFERGDVVTCAVVLRPQVQLVVARNHVPVAVITAPELEAAWPARGEWFPTVLLKNARARLLLDESPELAAFGRTVLPAAGGEARLWAMAATPAVRGVEQDEERGRMTPARRRARAKALRKALTADALSVVFAGLAYEELVRCWQVCRHWREAMARFNILERHELRCFFTRATVAEDVLGVGVFVSYGDDRNRPRAAGALPWIQEARCAMDVVSLRAWEEHGVRTDCLGQPMTHFLPLAINAGHARRAAGELRSRVAVMCQLSSPEACTAEAALFALGAVMNQFVVQLMSATTEEEGEAKRGARRRRELVAKHASEKALVGYVAFHHLLLHASKVWPRMAAVAGARVAKFVADEEFRTKQHVPDLGKFLVNLAVMPHAQRKAMKWGRFWRAFVLESMDRRVKWMVRDAPHLGDVKLAPRRRVADTLRATRVSRRLVAFQHWFFHHVAAPRNATPKRLLAGYHERWGRPTPALRRALLREVRGLLHGEDTWEAYFKTLRVPVTAQELPDLLRRAVERSMEKGYHRPPLPPRMPRGPPVQRRSGRGPAPRPFRAPLRTAAPPVGGSTWRPQARRRFGPRPAAFSSRFGDAVRPTQEQRNVKHNKKQQRRQAREKARRRKSEAASTTPFRVTGVPAGVSLAEVREHVKETAFALGGACRVVSVRSDGDEGAFSFVVSSVGPQGPVELRRRLAGSVMGGRRFGSVKICDA